MPDVVSIQNYSRPDTTPRQLSRPGEIKNFTQALNMCTVCMSSSHRASKCPQRVKDSA